MKKAFRIVTNTILILIIVLLLGYFALRVTNVVGVYKVLTGSMETGIHPGDHLLVTKQKTYKKGDIVTFQVDGNYVTHRIVKIENEKVTTKGDANNTEDEQISINDIVGKVIYKGKILNFIMNYKYILVTLLLFLFIISDIINKEDKKKEVEEEINEEQAIEDLEII